MKGFLAISFILIYSFQFAVKAGAGFLHESFCPQPPDSSAPGKLLIITNQALNRIIIADAETSEIVWEWTCSTGTNNSKDSAWFGAPSDAKPVLNGSCILITASKGGVALVRIRDKKTLFYAYAGGNTHSAAMLPDGNIVSASSTGSFLTLFHTDTLHYPAGIYSKKIFLPFAHNVVWDKKRQLLWSAGKNKIYSFQYNFDCDQPALIPVDSIVIPGNDAHDLYPVYGKELLWLTTPENVFTFDPVTHDMVTINVGITKNVKDISSGPVGYSTIRMLPKEKWWTDEVTDENGKIIFRQQGLKIYKARWLLPDSFSENKNDFFRPCK